MTQPDGEEIADRVAAAVLAVDGVADLHAGMFGEVGTYLAGRRVTGISIRDGVTDVRVSIHKGASIRETAANVRSAVFATVGGTVDVTIEDVVTDPTKERTR